MRPGLTCHLLACAVLGAIRPAAGQTPDSIASIRESNKEFQKLSGVLSVIRDRNAPAYAITTPNGLDEARYVTIGGIEQWITIRGESRDNPVLLVLHGGPGDATNPWGYAGLRTWTKHFTVVQWDQRGAGRTLRATGPSVASTVTIDRMTRDGIELAELLRRDLHKDKIVLLGHSWGSILGVFMAKMRPDLFYAYVGTGQVADPAANYAVAYEELIEKAKRVGDGRALRELQAVGPPPYPDGRGYRVQRTWANLFERADLFIGSMLGLAMTAPGYSSRDLNDWLDGQSLSGGQLVPQTTALTADTLAGDFALPVIVIQGAEDFTTPTRLARRFVASLRAPRKQFIALEGGGHFVAFMKPDAFLNELVRTVLPLTWRK